MNDIFGIGKVLPIDKLIDIVSSVTSRISKPYFDRKDVDTKAYEIKKIAEAKAEEMKIISTAIKENYLMTGGIEYKESTIGISSPIELSISTNEHSVSTNASLEDRIKDRVSFQEAKKQLNLENVTAHAAEQLKNEPPITDEPLNEDWKTRFFSIAEDITSDDMQALWGRILAGEIKQPKSYSLRTLELLKNLSTDEAEVFTKFANLKFISSDNNLIYNPSNGDYLKNEFGITFKDRLLMAELGLIVSEENLEFTLNEMGQDSSIVLLIGKKGILISRDKDAPKQAIEVLVFTKTGTELSKLIDPSPNENYIKKICSIFKHANVKIQYGDITVLSDGRTMMNNRTEYNG